MARPSRRPRAHPTARAEPSRCMGRRKRNGRRLVLRLRGRHVPDDDSRCEPGARSPFRNSFASSQSGASPSISIGFRRDKAAFTTLKVSHSNGNPILFLPAGPERSDLPNGWTRVQIDGEGYEANFVKVAVNVVRKSGDDANQLPRILRGWFGADAGAPGTRHSVSLQLQGSAWHLRPLGRRRGELKLWQSYSREEIPPLFGLEFSTAIWNVGFVKRPGHIFLLVTLDKSGHAEDFQYQDHFIDRDRVRVAEPEQDGCDERGRPGHPESRCSGTLPSTCSCGLRRSVPAAAPRRLSIAGTSSSSRGKGEKPITVTVEALRSCSGPCLERGQDRCVTA